MAFKSFRVRRVDLVASPDANPFGSYVRGTDTDAPAGLTRSDADSALRADGFIAAIPAFTNAQFNATATTYSSVNLSWSPFELKNPSTNAVGVSNIQSVVVVYSSTGAPETVADGVIVKTQAYNDTTYAVSHQSVPTGKWAYYSLFLYWNQSGVGASGVNWYERVATLQELVPKDYGLTDQLWDRIPAYYRIADTAGATTDPSGLSRGYLYRFFDIFGFEFNKTRTLLQSVISQYDPEETETESIEQLSKLVGLEVTPQDVGTSRIREIIKDITYYRQRKGTLDAFKQYLVALTGSRVDVVESTANPRYTFRVHAERANLVADSLFVITSGSKKWSLSTESGSITQSKTNEYITVTNSGGTSGQFALVSKVAVPSEAGTQYWSSVQLTGSGTIRGAQWASADTAWSNWATTSQSSQVLPTNLSPTGRKVILKPTLSTTDTRYPVLIFDLPAGTSTVISRWMVEPNIYGSFFNGDSVFGGFVYQNNKADYGWNGSQYASYSTYSTNRTKIQETILDLLPKLLPVTMLIDVATTLGTTEFDWIPGKT